MEVFLVFTDTKTTLSKMIKLYTRHAYSHVSVAFDSQLKDMYSFGRKEVENAFQGGFIKEDIRNKLFQRAECAIYKCEVTDEGYKSIIDYIQSLEQKQGQLKYNVRGLLGVVINKDIPREDAYFCSQFVAEVLMNGGIRIGDKPLNLIMPSDISNDSQLQYIYSGSLSDYPLLENRVSRCKEECYLMEAL